MMAVGGRWSLVVGRYVADGRLLVIVMTEIREIRLREKFDDDSMLENCRKLCLARVGYAVNFKLDWRQPAVG